MARATYPENFEGIILALQDVAATVSGLGTTTYTMNSDGYRHNFGGVIQAISDLSTTVGGLGYSDPPVVSGTAISALVASGVATDFQIEVGDVFLPLYVNTSGHAWARFYTSASGRAQDSGRAAPGGTLQSFFDLGAAAPCLEVVSEQTEGDGSVRIVPTSTPGRGSAASGIVYGSLVNLAEPSGVAYIELFGARIVETSYGTD